MNFKLYTISTLLVTSMAVSAQSLTEISTEEELMEYGGCQTFSMSPDGRFVCGATFAWSGFIYDNKEHKTLLVDEETGALYIDNSVQLLGVNGMGTAVGFDDNGGIMVNIDGNYEVLGGYSKETPMILPQSINGDGSVIVGSVANEAWVQQACYWKDGEINMLPMLTTAEAGFQVNGSVAMSVSEDGSTICGYILDRQARYPLVLWTLSDNGEYELNPVFMDYYEPTNVAIYDDEGRIIGYESGDKPYLIFTPGGMSPDGNIVALQVVPNKDDITYKVAFYDVEAGELEVIDNPGGVIDDYGFFTLVSVSNNKEAVGYAGILGEAMAPFIVYGKTGEDKTLNEAFPNIPELKKYQEFQDEGMPYLATSISGDGQYIAGYAVTIVNNTMVAEAFIINTTGEDAGVATIKDIDSREVALYSIDGKKLDRFVKGVNIIRYSDGTSRKFIIK